MRPPPSFPGGRRGSGNARPQRRRRAGIAWIGIGACEGLWGEGLGYSAVREAASLTVRGLGTCQGVRDAGGDVPPEDTPGHSS